MQAGCKPQPLDWLPQHQQYIMQNKSKQCKKQTHAEQCSFVPSVAIQIIHTCTYIHYAACYTITLLSAYGSSNERRLPVCNVLFTQLNIDPVGRIFQKLTLCMYAAKWCGQFLPATATVTQVASPVWLLYSWILHHWYLSIRRVLDHPT